MKTRIFGTAAALLLACGAAAAPVLAQGTQIGAKGGVQWASLTDEVEIAGVGESDSRLAWAAGGFLSIGLTPMFAIQPELMWTAKGAKFDVTGSDAEGEFSLTYAEIPVLLRLNFGTPMAGFRPYVMAGPYAAFETSCDVEVESDEGTSISDECGDADEDGRNTTLFGIAAGAGVEFPLADLASVLVEGRFEQDFTGIQDDEDGGDGEDFDPKNRIVGIYVGLSVPLSGPGSY